MADIRIHGEAAERVLQNISRCPELIEEVSASKSLQSDAEGDLSPEARALAATFCQYIAFGNAINEQGMTLAEKRSRNELLAQRNQEVFSVLLEDQPQNLIILGKNRNVVMTPGHVGGLAVVYPLNNRGDREWRNNITGPHRFSPEHLVSHESFQPARSAFIGGAIDLRSLQDMLSTPKLDFQPGNPPAHLIHATAKATLRFLPKVVGVETGEFGPRLLTEPKTKPIAIFTSFSGRGSGEMLAQGVGFIREGRIEKERGDRRYSVDLGMLDAPTTSLSVRHKIMKAWAWFERVADPEKSTSIVQAIHNAIQSSETKRSDG